MNNQLEIDIINDLVVVNEMFQEQNFTEMSKFFHDIYHLVEDKLADSVLQPDLVEISYVGLHLGTGYNESHFLKMIEFFKNDKIIHAKYAMKILKDSIKSFESKPNISEGNLKQDGTCLDTIIMGDLHGNFHDLYYIIQKYGIPGKNFQFVFNGDFVDRGSQQCEVLLTILYAYLLNPESVFINRGNHEDISITTNTNFSPNFQQATNKSFQQYSIAVFNEAQKLFRHLPLATIVENKAGFRCFIVHGGISNRIDLDAIKLNVNRFEFSTIIMIDNEISELLSDLMWSDPILREDPNEPKLGCWFNDQRGVGCYFGEDVSEEFCSKYGFNTIVRSHDMRIDGYSQDHPFCHTIFSASNYCYGNNKGAVYILKSDESELIPHSYTTEEFVNSKSLAEKKDAILRVFKEYLVSQYTTLRKKFQKYDPNGTGWIDVHKWAAIISRHVNKMNTKINPVYLVFLKDYFCPCDEKSNQVNYTKMTGSFDYEYKHFDFMKNAFNLIDYNQNRRISYDESVRVIEILNRKFETKYDSSYLMNMDKNEDGFIDFEEFSSAFSTN